MVEACASQKPNRVLDRECSRATGLIALRILRVFKEVKAPSDNPILAATGGRKLRRIILVLIESGMALFSIQFARLMFTMVWTEAAYRVFTAISMIHQMLNGIIPTNILVRTSMPVGLSFQDEKSMEEVATGSLRFASNHLNSVPEMGGISIVAKDDKYIDVRRSNDIDIVER